MRLSTEHFIRQNRVPDDVLRTIARESTSMRQVARKCKMNRNAVGIEKILTRIIDLGIDITHFNTTKKRTKYKRCTKLDAIDDETFKTLFNNNRNISNFALDCGIKHVGMVIKKQLIDRINLLGLNIDHFDSQLTDTDKIFVVNSQYTSMDGIKKRLVTDLGWRYECNECKNVHFVEQDAVLTWMNKPVILQLDHINGIRDDNRVENLRFLCALCHSQTSTWCGKNSKRHKTLQAWLEEGKTCHVPGSIASLLN